MEHLNFDGGGQLNARLCQKKKKCFFLCDYADGEKTQKKKKQNKKSSARGTAKKINAEQLAVENIRARKNGTSPPPLKDKWCIEKVSELRKLIVSLQTK